VVDWRSIGGRLTVSVCRTGQISPGCPAGLACLGESRAGSGLE